LAAELSSATVRGFLKNMYHTFLAVQPPSTGSLLMPLAQPDHLQIGSSSPDVAIISMHVAIISMHVAIISMHVAIISMHVAIISIHVAIISMHLAIISMHVAIIQDTMYINGSY